MEHAVLHLAATPLPVQHLSLSFLNRLTLNLLQHEEAQRCQMSFHRAVALHRDAPEQHTVDCPLSPGFNKIICDPRLLEVLDSHPERVARK